MKIIIRVLLLIKVTNGNWDIDLCFINFCKKYVQSECMSGEDQLLLHVISLIISQRLPIIRIYPTCIILETGHQIG